MRKQLAAAGLAAYLAFILYLTLLLPLGGHPHLNIVPLRTVIGDWRMGGSEFVVNFLGNLVAFMPFGILIPASTGRPWRWWQVAACCGTISASIELGQYRLGRRVADVDDILLNTLGGLAGYGFLLGWRRFRAGRPGTLAPQTDG